MAKKASIPERLRRQVQERAQGRCEYCLIRESDMYYPHELPYTRTNAYKSPLFIPTNNQEDKTAGEELAGLCKSVY